MGVRLPFMTASIACLGCEALRVVLGGHAALLPVSGLHDAPDRHSAQSVRDNASRAG